jgi:hypothetical protein
MKYKFIFFAIAVLIIPLIFLLKNQKVNTLDDNTFDQGLSTIKVNSEIATNALDLKNLIGKSRAEIESLYGYYENYSGLNEYNVAMLDNCIVIYYDNDFVTQVSSGPEWTDNCFDEKQFDRSLRLTLLGNEDQEVRFKGLPGFGEYLYFSKGVSIIKEGDKLFQIWITSPMNEMEYNQRFMNYGDISDREERLNQFSYNPFYDEDGNILDATHEL